MPALILFRRKWLIACDDLVIPYFMEACLRMSWFIAGLIIVWYNLSDCSEFIYTKIFIYSSIGNLLLSSVFSIILSFLSAKGSVLEVQKRTSLSTFLYLKLFIDFIDFGIAVVGIWACFTEADHCFGEDVFLKTKLVASLMYTFGLMFGMFAFFNSMGSSKYWDNDKSLRFFRKAESAWKFRLKFLCCCATMNEDNDFMYVEISTFLASFLNGVDFVPTDILAGILTLSERHAIERRNKSVFLSSLAKSNALIEIRPKPSWMTAENAVYFLRIATSTYGWLVFFDVLQPWSVCTLLTHARCCFSCCYQYGDRQSGDCCCSCNSSALKKITGFTDDSILYASFSNSIYEPAFYVALDHERKYIIIAIRGTRSFSDIVTDIDGEEEVFPSEYCNTKFKCHRGVLRSAMYLLKKLKELNILSIAAAENPSYTIALTGHSLGGSVAAVLGLLLKPEFHSLQCYAFAPLACLSSEGVPETLDCVFSVVIGDDMIPRLCLSSCKQLRLHLLKSLKETQAPKYKILTRALWNYIKKYFNITEKTRMIKEAHDNKNLQIDEEAPYIIPEDYSPKEAKLYAPGRILYLKKIYKYQALWITGLSLQNIVVSSGMIVDHQPHQINRMLETYAKNANDTGQDICTRL